ncbi:hypothetical protein BpHYR1_020442 [Brachionus plicatilis]|uniref:Uncharacterized protein n=1 Tax=Brachionus plicatilis TaxID=10195 RepID=A0A3M7P938_BRAPC|nr:hypothetical protein BpHYR1_020442 [Brachionus plicatilis]
MLGHLKKEHAMELGYQHKILNLELFNLNLNSNLIHPLTHLSPVHLTKNKIYYMFNHLFEYELMSLSALNQLE